MLPNEVFALACRAYYDENGLVVDSRNGEFAHCPYPKGMCETGYYLLHSHHQHQGILQSKDLGQCCFFLGYAKKWLLECNYFPEDYFELWDIYEKYASEQGKSAIKKSHKVIYAEKDELGRSILGVKNAEKLNAEKNKNGKSVNALKGNMRQKELGVGIYALTLNQIRDNVKKIHEEKNEEGKSKHAVKAGISTHKEKDNIGRSINGVKTAERTNSQDRESTIDGFRGNPGNVALHNKTRGWDPKARVKITN